MSRSLFVLLAAVVVAGSVWLPLSDEQPEPMAGGPSALVAASRLAGSTDNLDRRPLFNEARRPEPGRSENAGRPSATVDHPILRGVMRVGGAPAIVILEVPGDGRIHRAAVGEAAGDWEIVSESDDGVVVRHAQTGAEQQLLLPSL